MKLSRDTWENRMKFGPVVRETREGPLILSQNQWRSSEDPMARIDSRLFKVQDELGAPIGIRSEASSPKLRRLDLPL